MAAIADQFLRGQLEERRQRLQAALGSSAQSAPLIGLLQEVDKALERMDTGTYGICEACDEAIEKERLIADPLVRYCLDHLTREQQRDLQEDLELASRIQRALLPPSKANFAGWEVNFHYEPAGVVSGDYCDLIHSNNGAAEFVFLLGDVSGKGVAASMLMTHLHAMFRSLTSVGLPLVDLLSLANRVFCESTIAGQYATLVCGRATRAGDVEILSAGHCPALVARASRVESVSATGLPLGMFSSGQYPAHKINLEPGESLILYTDGVSEMCNPSGVEYGVERLSKVVGEQHSLAPDALVSACLKDLKSFAAGSEHADDLTLMVLRRTI